MYADRAGSSRFRSSALRIHWEIRCTAKENLRSWGRARRPSLLWLTPAIALHDLILGDDEAGGQISDVESIASSLLIGASIIAATHEEDYRFFSFAYCSC